METLYTYEYGHQAPGASHFPVPDPLTWMAPVGFLWPAALVDPRSLCSVGGMLTQAFQTRRKLPEENHKLYFYLILTILWFLEMAFKICF